MPTDTLCSLDADISAYNVHDVTWGEWFQCKASVYVQCSRREFDELHCVKPEVAYFEAI
jgi:hypothetical protein